jgi:ATP-dependent exoDNAse (exonuclease V) alpha subunit
LPSRLVEVPGLGPKRTAQITAAWQEQKAIKEVMVFLQGVGVSTSIAVRIYKKYGAVQQRCTAAEAKSDRVKCSSERRRRSRTDIRPRFVRLGWRDGDDQG